MATTKKPAGLKATSKPGSVSREELTQITKALTALAKEVKSLKSQLSEAKLQNAAQTPTSPTAKVEGELHTRLMKYARDKKDEKLTWCLTSNKALRL